MKERPILFSAQERFDAFVMFEPNTGCWLWTGAINAKGYGRHARAMAHRVSLALVGRLVPAPWAWRVEFRRVS